MDQYGAPYLSDQAKASQVRSRPPKAYLAMYQSSPVPPETKGKKIPELEALFQQKKWNGMTLPEYLVLQRREFEQNKSHSFDAYDDSAARSQWTFLLDSVLVSGVVSAIWDTGESPGGRGLGGFWPCLSEAGRSPRGRCGNSLAFVS